jgi:hypothetical protein
MNSRLGPWCFSNLKTIRPKIWRTYWWIAIYAVSQSCIKPCLNVWKLKCLLYNNVSFFYILKMENHEIQDFRTLCKMEIKLTFPMAPYMTWNVSICASAIMSKLLFSVILMIITASFCVVAPKVCESEYKALLQVFSYNVALHVMTIMFWYYKRQHCGTWWASLASTTRRRKVAVQQRMMASEKTTTMIVGNLQLPIISSSSKSWRCLFYHHQPRLPRSSLASTRGSSQSFSQFWFFYWMLQHL